MTFFQYWGQLPHYNQCTSKDTLINIPREKLISSTTKEIFSWKIVSFLVDIFYDLTCHFKLSLEISFMLLFLFLFCFFPTLECMFEFFSTPQKGVHTKTWCMPFHMSFNWGQTFPGLLTEFTMPIRTHLHWAQIKRIRNC